MVPENKQQNKYKQRTFDTLKLISNGHNLHTDTAIPAKVSFGTDQRIKVTSVMHTDVANL